MITSMHPNIARMLPMVEAVVALLHPYAEGAIHDLEQGKIIALHNNISKRKIGDTSVVTEMGVEIQDFPDFFDPYYKTNWDGRKLKCTSVTIRDDAGTPIGLICINFDTTVFENIDHTIRNFLTLKNTKALNPIEQFAVDWRQNVNDFIGAYTAKHSIALSALSKQQKSDLVKQLYAHGLFNYRDSATHIARTLGVSRTSVYNYLNEV